MYLPENATLFCALVSMCHHHTPSEPSGPVECAAMVMVAAEPSLRLKTLDRVGLKGANVGLFYSPEPRQFDGPLGLSVVWIPVAIAVFGRLSYSEWWVCFLEPYLISLC